MRSYPAPWRQLAATVGGALFLTPTKPTDKARERSTKPALFARARFSPLRIERARLLLGGVGGGGGGGGAMTPDLAFGPQRSRIP